MTDTTTNTTTTTTNKPRRQTASAPPHPPNHASPSSPRPQQFLSYMHRPPRILPNYGKRPRGVLPKSSVSRVLLYDNVTQQQMLDVKMTYLQNEQVKTGRLMDMHRKSFLTRRQQKERQMAETALHVDHELLEQGLLSSTTTHPRHPDPHHPNHHHHHNHKSRTESHRTFNPYLAPEPTNAWQRTAYDVTDPRVTWDPNSDTIEDSPPPPQNGDLSAEETSVQLLPVEGQRAVTSDCLTLPHHPLPAKPGGAHRAATTAQQLKGQGDTLPSIHALSGRVTVDTEHQSGFTRILHTFQDSWETGGGGVGGGGGGGVGGGGGGGGGSSSQGVGTARRRGGHAAGGGKRTTEDERYRMLERMLVRLEPPNEGYLELSPSFHTPRQPMTFTRPSSLHPSLYRRRSSSSSSSLRSSSSSSRTYTRPFSIQI